jgi:acyl-CoA reductase-like NAD-dependent aldehyde dehydrogenase
MAVSTLPAATALDGHEATESCYIDGAWVQGDSAVVADVLDPSTEESLIRLRLASVEQVRAAIGAARRAFDAGRWPSLSARDRSLLLHRLTDLFEQRREEFEDLITSEIGSPPALTKGGQVGASIDTFRWFADAAAHSTMRRSPAPACCERSRPESSLVSRHTTSRCSYCHASSAGSSPPGAPASSCRRSGRR